MFSEIGYLVMKKKYLLAVPFYIAASLVFLCAMTGSCNAEEKLPQPVAVRATAQGQSPEVAPRKLTLADAVAVALTNNVTLRSAYLDRHLQRIDLELAERKYYLPTDPTLTLGLNRSITNSSATSRMDNLNTTGKMDATLAIPTGGTFTFAWNNKANRPDLPQNFNYSSDWSATFTQPLLKGGGIENAAYTVRVARITEEQNILTLKDTIASTIKTTITAFRAYKTAERQLLIANMGLVRAKSLYEYNKDMIAAGRIAGTEIVQAQADIASQETSVISAKNSLDDARLTLIQAMYVDKKTTFDAVDESEMLVSPPSLEEAMSLAFQHRTDYQRSLKNLESKKLELAKNKRNRLWSLNLTAATTDSASSTTFDSYNPALQRAFSSAPERDWTAGVALQIPLVYMTSDMRSYLGSKTELQKLELTFEKQKLDIEISVVNAVRNVDANYRALMSAKQARDLAEKKLNIEQEKLGAGRTTNFQIVTFQKDLQTAQLNELTAMTTYLNALTSLDDTLGTILATWRIDVRKEDDRIRTTAAASPKDNPRDQKNGK